MVDTGSERSPKRVSAAAVVLAGLVFAVYLAIPLGVAAVEHCSEWPVEQTPAPGSARGVLAQLALEALAV